MSRHQPDQAQSHLIRTMQAALEQRDARQTRRRLTPIPASAADFSSNDFLSLGSSPAFRDRYLENLRQVSASHRLANNGSRLLDGNSQYAEDLERFIADFHNAPCGLLFTSGFDANVSVFSCVPQPGDIIIHDELIHASTHNGMRLSRAGKRIPFKHNSVEALELVIRTEKDRDPLINRGTRNVFVAVETVYSMDGDFAPIKEMLDAMERLLPNKNGHMIVDEAHSTGVFGPRGAGIVQALGVEHRVFLRLHTFGKAVAANGAIVLCSPVTRDYLLNYARPLIFTTALGLQTLVLIRTAYELMSQGKTEQLQKAIQERVAYLDKGLAQVAPAEKSILDVRHHTSSPIFALITRYPRELAKMCQDRGIIARPIMSPTVAVGTERVRVCVHAGNTVEELQKLIDTVAEWVRRKQKGLSRL
ncbi:hypothetical protein VTO42DRAFT_8237 [Malbranchea cinnamomea]